VDHLTTQELESEQQIYSAEIISIGTELLLGQTVNTNARDLACELSELGISNYYQAVVGDNPVRMEAVIKQGLGRSDLVITTGGLGPTEDDITMEVCAKIAGTELVFNPEAEKWIRDRIVSHHYVLTSNNWKQAMLPKAAKILFNAVGTAPGALFQFDYAGKSRFLAVLPGPPLEMNTMFERELKPWLRTKTSRSLQHIYIRTTGLGESRLTSMISDIIHEQSTVSIAPYAEDGEVVLRLSVMASSDQTSEELKEIFQPVLNQIRNRLGEYIYSVENKTLPQIVVEHLSAQNAKVSFAESCTAGLLSAELASAPGASNVFSGSIIVYANELKKSLLGVSAEILQSDGAVSEECAIAMAKGIRSLLQTDYAVSVTGIAGPEGGTAVKPVGTVWIGLSECSGTFARHFILRGGRNRIRRIAALNALDLLRRQISAE
jgi:nicotinamide-nucleotide amidase